jgi:hypothetical protein
MDSERRTRMTVRELVDDLDAIDRELRTYERTYGLASASVYDLFTQGKLDDGDIEETREYGMWAGLYSIRLKRERELIARSDALVRDLAHEGTEGGLHLRPVAELVEAG